MAESFDEWGPSMLLLGCKEEVLSNHEVSVIVSEVFQELGLPACSFTACQGNPSCRKIRIKAVDLLLAALKKVAGKYGTDYREPTETIIKQLRNIADTGETDDRSLANTWLALSETIEWCFGKKTAEELSAEITYYGRHHLFSNPSGYSEYRSAS